MKKLALALVALVLVVVAAIAAAPRWVESRYNRVLRRPPYPTSTEATRLHRELTVVDLHADSLLWSRNLLERSDRGHIDIPRLLDANVALQVFTVVTKIPQRLNLQRNTADSDLVTALAVSEGWPPATWRSLKQRALYQASRLREMADQSRGELVVVTSAAELESVLARRKKPGGTVGALLGLEGAHALQNDRESLDELYRAGFRLVGLTHFSDNEWAGSSTGMQQRGLTAAGRRLIARLESRHMLVDLAHASSSTIDDVTAIAQRPVIVSHTGVRGTCNNSRNLADKQIREVAQTGGVIGIGYWHTATCGADAEAVARAIRYTANLVGVEHVALGSDFDGATTMPFDTTGLPQITQALLQQGFSEREIRLIMGENTLRVLRQILE